MSHSRRLDLFAFRPRCAALPGTAGSVQRPELKRAESWFRVTQCHHPHRRRPRRLYITGATARTLSLSRLPHVHEPKLELIALR